LLWITADDTGAPPPGRRIVPRFGVVHGDKGTIRSVMGTDAYREAAGHFTTGVAVITTLHEGRRYGVTASAVSSLSLDPPMLLVCLHRSLATRDAVVAAGRFAVNVLAEDHAALAMQFATRAPDKFAGVALEEGLDGVPLLSDALSHLQCTVVDPVDAATHTVLLAEVDATSIATGSPLAYFRGSFGRFEMAA
jgi:4-nitrophenol 2-monooxygenase / 4-nitrocatechol 4-monooxygenase, reductase component